MSPVRVVLVRHGQAATAWGTDADPGLSPLGQRQAQAAAEALAPLGPQPMLTSPMRRCRETAAALAERWATEPVVCPAVGEIPNPAGVDGLERSAWLGRALAGRWSDLPADLEAWRDGVVAAIAGVGTDTVVFTHFVAINAVLGWAAADGRVTVARPDNCSRTVVEVDGGRLVVVTRGAEADTEVR
jgi:broad specificity phosphatase PhoE